MSFIDDLVVAVHVIEPFISKTIGIEILLNYEKNDTKLSWEFKFNVEEYEGDDRDYFPNLFSNLKTAIEKNERYYIYYEYYEKGFMEYNGKELEIASNSEDGLSITNTLKFNKEDSIKFVDKILSKLIQ